MNILLIFLAIPLATIILSAIFETFIRCPWKVAGIAFSIFIIVAFALGGTAELILLAFVYTTISLITALITEFILRKIEEDDECDYTICNSNANSRNDILNYNNSSTETSDINDYNNINNNDENEIISNNVYNNEYYNLHKTRTLKRKCNRR